MIAIPTSEPRSDKPLELYNLHDEKPNWLLAFDADPKLYGQRGLQDFLTYLDSILSQSGAGPATREKFQSKRDEVQAVLDRKVEQAEEAKRESKAEFQYPTDFDHE